MTSPSPIQEKLMSYEIPQEQVSKDIQREGAATGEFHSQSLCEFLAWGEGGCSILATAGVVEIEYAALQKSYGLFDASCRGTIEIKGTEQLEFIERLSTQKLIDMKEGESLPTFIVNQKGRIIADAIVRHVGKSIWVDADITCVQSLLKHMNAYIVMEDVTIRDCTDEVHWLWLLGPNYSKIQLDSCRQFPFPKDILGIDGIAIAVDPTDAVALWNSFIEQGVKPIGWFALNMARVEVMAPVFLIDFDTNNLPHETSLITSRVRFDKGCYLGQEIVARMESLGKPKQHLVQLCLENDELPIAGSQLWQDQSSSGTPIGVVTSSALSPIRGGVAAVIAMVGKKFSTEGTIVHVYVGLDLFQATIKPLHSNKDVEVL